MFYTFRYRYSLPNRAFPKAKHFVVCAEFLLCSKLHFAQWKIFFAQFIFIDKCLKFKAIQYLSLCWVWNVTSLISYELPLFSTVELKLGHSFSQCILRFKIRIFNVGLKLYFQVFPNSQKHRNWMLAKTALPNFSQFSNFHILPDCEDCLSGLVCV